MLKTIFGSYTKITVILAILLIVGCSGDGAPKPEWTGLKTSTGKASVAGNYEFLSDSIDYSCSNGAVMRLPKVSSTSVVSQTEGNISIQVSGTGLIFDPLTLVGTVDNVGNIYADQTTWYDWSGIGSAVGQVLITSKLRGAFTPTGWSGTYTLTFNFRDYDDMVCYPSRPFSGNKL